jgi:microcin C transport system substrate-binding protein
LEQSGDTFDMPIFSRRRHFIALAAAIGVAGGATSSLAQDAKRLHALSLVGEPKFKADFKHFDWVNPDAPKAGTVKLWARGGFDTLYPFNIKGNKASGLALTYDTLMVNSPDEASTEYCLLCEWVSHPDDFSSVTFALRAGAKFHDGKPVTPEDVIFSLETLKRDSPFHAQYYKNVTKAEVTGERQVTFRFDAKGNRELPQIMGQLYVLPKHYWTAKDAKGEVRDPSKTTLDTPLGSGPYKIKAFEPGRFIEYERVKDWWAKDLPVSKGQWNFDGLRIEYFRDQTAAFEEFKAGRIDFWRESSAKQWATAFDLPQIKAGTLKKEQITEKEASQMQAFAFNLRRKQFQDPRVRQAFNLAFNFEDANKNLFYGQYARVLNFFGEADLKATGLPTGRELAILEPFRKELPAEVFTVESRQPVAATPEAFRANLRAAAKLLLDAGWTPKNGVLHNAKGEQLVAEFLLADASFERVVQPYVQDLKKLGVAASIRTVDPAQYQRREDDFDFDIITSTFAQSASPGNEQREFWGSQAADIKGSRNVIGIKSPVIDKLIDIIIFAKDRAELQAATKALDRVLLASHYVVPQWYSAFDRIAYWNMFARPAKLPSRSTAFQQVWWVDDAAAKKLAEVRGK